MQESNLLSPGCKPNDSPFVILCVTLPERLEPSACDWKSQMFPLHHRSIKRGRATVTLNGRLHPGIRTQSTLWCVCQELNPILMVGSHPCGHWHLTRISLNSYAQTRTGSLWLKIIKVSVTPQSFNYKWTRRESNSLDLIKSQTCYPWHYGSKSGLSELHWPSMGYSQLPHYVA